ncbi:Hypothetical protein R9X50_00152100 [Acrodontium crateriforme]|uniref:BSD domain-containing protein n=1 Tax=Acrodontium crateriforme TaxID=150365 RepID=A0AAQ3LZV9_9PEZI|nr:Hypothetical protein R9X50_00152100 [Acrodontium crateriforme]
MDIAYDQIQDESFAPEQHGEGGDASASNINAEFQSAFRAVSSSPWGSKLGGWISQARKQGETFYQDLQKEAGEAQEQATKGLSSLREQVAQRARGISLSAEPGPEVQIPGEEAVPFVVTQADGKKKMEDTYGGPKAQERVENLPADIVKEAGSLVASLRLTAAAKLKDLQAAEDAADEALLKFGTNVRNFLRDAVVISAPTDADSNKPRGTDGVGNEVLFETQEPGTGRKIFHTTRLDAQLHAIHTSAISFTEDPQGAQWEDWRKELDIENQTDVIAQDLKKYEELRRAMEKLVPEKVEYKTFWTRYYFLRKAVEEEERRRKEVLKGATTNPEEEVAWDDDDEEESTTPNPTGTSAKASASTTTLTNSAADSDHLKPGRNSSDENKSVADSDASYDIVSGAASRAHGSPKEEKKKDAEESDDDWE